MGAEYSTRASSAEHKAIPLPFVFWWALSTNASSIASRHSSVRRQVWRRHGLERTSGAGLWAVSCTRGTTARNAGSGALFSSVLTKPVGRLLEEMPSTAGWDVGLGGTTAMLDAEHIASINPPMTNEWARGVHVPCLSWPGEVASSLGRLGTAPTSSSTHISKTSTSSLEYGEKYGEKCPCSVYPPTPSVSTTHSNSLEAPLLQCGSDPA
jgi:hypothetical protein